MIKHISFDLWLTLIASHPDFKQKRAELIADKFNDNGLSAESIGKLVRETDIEVDAENSHTGLKKPAVDMYKRILKETLSTSDEAILTQKAKLLELGSNDLFVKYQPTLLNEAIESILQQLKSEGYTLNISSNTGFIEEKTLRTVLGKMNLLQYFSFCIFSDEIKASKPSGDFFRHVHNNSGVNKPEILHIGDNRITDYEGAIRYGFASLLIENRNYTLNDIRAKLQG